MAGLLPEQWTRIAAFARGPLKGVSTTARAAVAATRGCVVVPFALLLQVVFQVLCLMED